jgi:hypothetical protein
MRKSNATLKELLVEWLDFDGAAHAVGQCLGLWGEYGAPHDKDPWRGTKHIFWSRNPLGEALHNLLLGLVEDGMLEISEDGLKFRWNSKYQGDWDEFV